MPDPRRAQSPSPERPRSSPQQKEEERRKKLSLFSKIAASILTVCALIFLVFLWQGDRIAHHLGAREAGRLTAEAGEAVSRGDLDAAGALIAEALERDTGNPEANRLAASLEKYVRPATAAARLEYLHRSGEASIDDRVDLLALQLSMGQLDAAEALAHELVEAAPENARLHTVAAKVHLQLGNTNKAEELIATAHRLNPDLLETRLLKAQLQLASPMSEVRQVASQTIREVAEADPTGDAGLEALRAIEAHRSDFTISLEKYFLLFKNHPLRPADSDPTLPLLAWEFDLYPGKRKERAREAIAAWRAAGLNGKPLDLRLRWLIEHGCSAEVAAHLAGSAAREGDASLVPARLAALIEEGDLDGAGELVRELRNDPRYVTLSYLCEAIVMAETDRPGNEIEPILAKGLEKTLVSGRRDPEALFRIGRLASELGLGSLAREAFHGAMKDDPAQAHLALAVVAEREGDVATLLNHIEAVADLDRGNKALLARVTYFQLLQRTHADAARESAARLHASSPRIAELMLVAAFAHHVFEEHEDALALARAIDSAVLPNAQRVPLVAIFRTAGEHETAARIAATIDRSTLLPPEIALLEGGGE